MRLDEPVVTVADGAASKLRGVMATDKQALRIAVVRSHCMGGRGFTYQLALEDSPADDDEAFEDNGVKVCVDPASAKYLGGAELDFVDTPESSGFKVTNPNAIAQCPCGHHDIFE
jgi:iron-sulfur cluster assembly protein